MSSLRATGGADVDPYLYLDPPVLDASGLLALGQALLDGASVTPPPSLFGPLRRLRQACDDLQTALRQVRETPAPAAPIRQESRQPADFALDTAWTALYERLRAYVMLPESEVPKVKRAQELLRLLFPDALGFLRLPYETEWNESDRRLRSVEKLSLVPDLDAVAGPEFLTEVRRAHELYSRALGRRPDGSSSSDNERPPGKESPRDSAKDKDKDARDSGESPAVRDLRFHLARCISAYALKVLALTPDDVKDYQSTKRWLAPLSAFQRAESRKNAAGQTVAGGTNPSGGATAPTATSAAAHGHGQSHGLGHGVGHGAGHGPGHATTRTGTSPSLHEWASSLRANDSSGDNKAVSDSGLIRSSAARSGSTAAPSQAQPSPPPGGSMASPPRSSQAAKPEDLALPRPTPAPPPASDSRLGGQSGTFRPVGESGLFRPIKRPPS